MKFFTKSFLSISLIFALIGCSSIDKSIKHGKVEVSTKMSDSIFIDHVADHKKTIYVKITNTSDYQQLNVYPDIVGSLVAKGYQVVQDPDKAQYILQANILKMAKVKDGEDPFGGLSAGYEGALVGGLVGYGIGGGKQDAMMGALIGAGIGYLSDVMVKVVSYSLVTDVKISERLHHDAKKTHQTKIKSKTLNGNQLITEEYNEDRLWRRHTTRITSAAIRTNLKIEEVESLLKQGLGGAIAGIF